MAVSSRSPENQHAHLAKVARLYYLNEMNQRDISARLNVSIASVSRALARAKALGIVQFSINDPGDSRSQLEIAMETQWNVNECLIVPETDTVETTYRSMAQKLTELLARALRNGDTAGVSWGKTLKSVSEQMEPIGRSEVEVVPIIGAMGTVETGIYPNSIAREFADKVGGTAYLMNTPAVVDTEAVRDSLQSDSNFQMVRQVWDRLDVVLLSVSALDEETSAFESGIFNRQELAEMRERGGVCATNFSILDEDGGTVPVPISRRIINLPFEELRCVPEVILIAGGPQKAAPLRAALRSQVVTKLITDETCALELLGSPRHL